MASEEGDSNVLVIFERQDTFACLLQDSHESPRVSSMSLPHVPLPHLPLPQAKAAASFVFTETMPKQDN